MNSEHQHQEFLKNEAHKLADQERSKLTTTMCPLVKLQDIDDHFTERYGKDTFLSMYDLDASNWAKMIKGDRKMPKVYANLCKREQEIERLQQVIARTNPNLDTQAILDRLDAKDNHQLNSLRIENDKLKSAFRMAESMQGILNAILKKVK
jgi:hypothetical protein